MTLANIPAHLLRAAAAIPSNAHAREALERALRDASPQPVPLSSPAPEVSRVRAEGVGEVAGETAPGEYRCPVDPMGKPRQTQSDQWKERPAVMRYRAFADELRAWADANHFSFPESGCHVRFELPMPRTWTKQKRAAMDGQPHQQTPDVDNLTKAVLDALLANDCRVWQVSAEKRWAQSGAVVFSL